MRHLKVIAIALLFCVAAPSYALVNAVPGESLLGIEIGSSRTAAITKLNNQLGKDARRKSDTDKSGLISDHWIIHKGYDVVTFDILSVKGKVVQLVAGTTNERGQTDLTFAELIKKYPLTKNVYAFVQNGGGHQSYYYDDVERGICYAFGTQDVLLLTYRPNTLIVHRPGYAPFPIEDGIRGKAITGSDAKVYENEEELEKAAQHELDEYRNKG